MSLITPQLQSHGYAHALDALQRAGGDASLIRENGNGGWRLPGGFRFYVRTLTHANKSGEWWFSVGRNVLGFDSGFVIFVFGAVWAM